MNILQINPVAFEVFGWSVHWYGLIIGLAMLVGYTLFVREAVRKGIDSDLAFDLFFWSIMIGLLGARLYFVVFSWDLYADDPIRALFIWQGGMAIYGGVLAGAGVLLYFCRKFGFNLLNLFDIAVPALMMGQSMGRWGNFINQEAHGGQVSRGFLENLYLPDWIIDQMQIQGQYYQPTFLYESVWNLLGCLIILVLRQKENFFKRGDITAFYAIWYGVGRYFIEGLRTDSLYLGNFRVSQLVSLAMIGLGLIRLIYNRRQINPPIPNYSSDRNLMKGLD